MKKKPVAKTPPRRPARVSETDILPEYDFSRARPNPYAKRLAVHDTVVLDPDVAELFPDSAAVNDALRALARITQRAPAAPGPGWPKSRHHSGLTLFPATTILRVSRKIGRLLT
jgi:hypothetical protein